jgi:hypothetical protein
MALQIDTVSHACEMITRQIRDSYRQLTINFVVHHDGQVSEALSLAAQDMLSHPAAETALHIIRKKRQTQESALLGTAVAKEQILFGLASRETALALCTLNIDDFDNLKEARRYAYHLAWHAIDAFEFHNTPATREDGNSRVVVRKRNALAIAAANLRADAFSAIMCSLQDDYEAIRKLAALRGMAAISRRSGHTPEYYPFAIAMEAAEFAAQQLRKKNLPRKKLVTSALQSARAIGKTFDDVLLRQWLGFSQPAQDMAWRGFEKDEILSAAINTSQNTYVRAAGYLISEITGIPPASILEINESYSPFADDRFNEKLHQKLVEKTFEDVIAEGLKRNSSDPFFETAERQNQELTEGRVVGWCASALHSAARGFDQALVSGNSPAAAARREFESEKEKTTWETLKDLGKNIIRNTRNGQPMTLSSVEELARNTAAAAAISRSIQATIKTAAYQQRMDNAAELHVRSGPKPLGIEPFIPVVTAPQGPATPAHAVQGPSLGRTGRATQMPQRQNAAATTQDAAQKTAQGDNTRGDNGTV